MVGSNCVNRGGRKAALMQVGDDENDPIHGPSKPPGGFPWTAWDPSTLPYCKHWRNAYEVPYPMVGANCVNERHEELSKDALVQEPWDPDSLGSCKDRKPAHEVPFPMVGANCVN